MTPEAARVPMDWAGLLGRLAIWRGYEPELTTLLLYGVGIAVYTAFVFAFYRTVSRRHAIEKTRPGGWGKTVRAFEWVFMMPGIAFAYFAMLAAALFLLAKSQTTDQIVLIALGVVVGVRVTSFLHEEMSADLARIVPLGLLGVVLVDPGYLSLAATKARLLEAAAQWPLLARAFALLVALEVTLQTVGLVRHRAKPTRRLVPTSRLIAELEDIKHR